MSRTEIEWDIYRILISHLDDDYLSDTIASEITQHLLQLEAKQD